MKRLARQRPFFFAEVRTYSRELSFLTGACRRTRSMLRKNEFSSCVATPVTGYLAIFAAPLAVLSRGLKAEILGDHP